MDSVTASESEDEQRIRCGSNLIKCFVIFVNLVFMVIGFALVSFVVWIHINRENLIYIRLFEDSPSAPHHSHLPQQQQQQQQQQLQQQHIPSGVVQKTTVIVVVVVVVAIIAFGFLGCCGASVDSVCFLCLCVVLIASVVTAEIVIATMLPSVKAKMYSDLSLRMHHQVRSEYNRTTFEAAEGEGHSAVAEHHHQLTVAWDTLQMKFNCCGVSDARDFRFSVWYNQTDDEEGLFVPKSCCILLTDPGSDQHPVVVRNDPFCQIEALLYEDDERTLVELRPSGCHSALVSYIDTYFRHPLTIVIYVTLILLQVLDVLFCCILSQRIRRRLAEIDLSESIDGETDGSEED